MSPLYFGNPHYQLHCECHEGEGNRCLGNARVAHLLSVHCTTATVLEDQTLEGAYPNG